MINSFCKLVLFPSGIWRQQQKYTCLSKTPRHFWQSVGERKLMQSFISNWSQMPIMIDNICSLTTKVTVICLGGEQASCAWKWKWNCYTHTAIEQRIYVGWGTTTFILNHHSGRSFSFALLQSETYKKEMLGEVYSKEAPDGGKTKGTSHYPPWGTCTLKLCFFALLLILSTWSPRVHCTLSCSRLLFNLCFPHS